jgi:hypothetical protein
MTAPAVQHTPTSLQLHQQHPCQVGQQDIKHCSCSAVSTCMGGRVCTPAKLAICAGTMLFGESQDYPTACQLLDECMAAGVNFFDTAEMYPVPQRAETQGLSESYLGKWMMKYSRCGTLPQHQQMLAYAVDCASASTLRSASCIFRFGGRL